MKRYYKSIIAALLLVTGLFVLTFVQAGQPVETEIVFEGEQAFITGEGAVQKGNVLEISQEGTYVLKGNWLGQVWINTNKKASVILILDEVAITSTTGPAIIETQAQSLTLYLKNNSTLMDQSLYSAEKEVKERGGIYAQDSLRISGEGGLTVISDHSYGIISKDDLMLEEGNLTITSKDTAFRGKDSVTIKGGELTLVSDEDGIKSNHDQSPQKGFVLIEGGNIAIIAKGEGIQAETSLKITGGDVSLTTKEKGLDGKEIMLTGGNLLVVSDEDGINGENITITQGNYAITTLKDGIDGDEVLIQGGEIMITSQNEGIEGEKVIIEGGNVVIFSQDDGINGDGGNSAVEMAVEKGKSGKEYQKNTLIDIKGGNVFINSEKGDALDSNGSIAMSAGSLLAFGAEEGSDVAIDFDGFFNLTGGNMIALGTKNKGQYPQSINQSVLVLYHQGHLGEEYVLYNQHKEELTRFSTQKAYEMIVLTHESLKEGESYTLTNEKEIFIFENIQKNVNILEK